MWHPCHNSYPPVRYSSCVVASRDHDYSSDIKGTPFNLYVAYITLCSDIVFTIPLLLSIICVLLYNGCILCCKTHSCYSNADLAFEKYIKCILGKKTWNKINQVHESAFTPFMLCLMLTTPLVIFTSHAGYILLAWLTEPSKCTANLVLFYVLFAYCYLSFKKCYEVMHKHYVSSSRRGAVTEFTSDMQEDNSNANSETRCCCFKKRSANEKTLNLQAFCLTFCFSFILMGMAVAIITTIILLPLPSSELATYLLNVFQLTLVFLSTQVAYELYFGSSFSFKHVFQKFRQVFADKKVKNYDRLVEIAEKKSAADEATGEFAAVLTDVIVQKFCTEDTQDTVHVQEIRGD